MLSVAVLRYARDARHGLVDPNRISGYHDFSGRTANFEDIISALASSVDAASLLLDAHPKEDSFQALRKELADLRHRGNEFRFNHHKKRYLHQVGPDQRSGRKHR